MNFISNGIIAIIGEHIFDRIYVTKYLYYPDPKNRYIQILGSHPIRSQIISQISDTNLCLKYFKRNQEIDQPENFLY